MSLSMKSRVLIWFMLLLASAVALQLAWLIRIAAMRVIDPQSSAFQRSQVWQIVVTTGDLKWRQNWLPSAAISDHLKRAIIASEDGGFFEHSGVDWTAIETAWRRNEISAARAARRELQTPSKPQKPAPVSKIVGGSTISQQLAKNIFLTGERNLIRKSQELIIALSLELFLSKDRLLEIYLNSVEWGEGVFGAEAAAQHYFNKPARLLSPHEAARLAVMLPAPKRFEKTPNSGHLATRTQTIVARMADVELP